MPYKNHKSPNKFYVYEHWRTDTNLPFYVGKGCASRARNMKYNRNPHHIAIQNKLKRIGDKVEVRIISRDMLEIEAYNYETQRISYWRDQGVVLVNLSDGGDGPSGFKHSETWKRALSERMKIYFSDPENRAAVSRRNKGRVLTPEQRAAYRGPKSHAHVEAMKASAKNRKRPAPRSKTHAANMKKAMDAVRERKLNDPEYIAELENKRIERAAKKARERLLSETYEALEAEELCFTQLMRAIANGTVRTCHECKALKAPEQMSKSKQTNSGCGSYCKKCCADQQRDMRNENRFATEQVS
jgi:hypothetical protein